MTAADAIVLQFSEQGDFGSKAIAWFTQGTVSHVDAIMPDGTLLGARNDSIAGIPAGVQVRPSGYAPFSHVVRVVLPCPRQMSADFYQLCWGEIGKPYDSEGILGFIVGRDWRDPSAWFCSELVGTMLERSGYFASPLATPANKLSPAGLLLACSGRVQVNV